MMRLNIEKIISHGKGLARHEGKVVFVEGALPGEIVDAELVSEKRDFAEARLAGIVQPSPFRIEAPCPYYGICGGCDFQHLTCEGQRILKLQILQDALRRGMGDDWNSALPGSGADSIPFHQAEPWHYRRRARFHITRNPDAIGFLQRAGREIVPVRACPVLDHAFDELLQHQDAESLMPSAVSSGRKTSMRNKQRRYAGSRHAPDSQLSVFQVPAFAGDTGAVFGDEETTVSIQNLSGTEKTFHFDPGVFFQSNTDLLGQLVSLAAGSLQDSPQKLDGKAADLFSGVGVFAAFLEERYAVTTAVERDSRCLAYARRNLSGGTQFITESVEKWSKQSSPAAHGGRLKHLQRLVVDPPRTGIDKMVLQRIASWEPKEFAYVSCNPVTFARDAARLKSSGYVLRLCEGFDLYPQTSHIEVFGLFTC